MDIGSVINVNIDDQITSCLIIDYRNRKTIGRGDYYLRLERVASFNPLNIVYTIFLNKKLYLEYEKLTSCYQLLIGDQKVWHVGLIQHI